MALWPVTSFVVFPFFRFGSAKVRRFFFLTSFSEKNSDFFFFAFQFFSPPVEAGCKGTVLFSAFARGLENKFFLTLYLDNARSKTSQLLVKHRHFQFSSRAVAVEEPVVRLTIWDCKSRRIFRAYKG